MIDIPDCDIKFLLQLNEEYGLTNVNVSKNSKIFSDELIQKVCTDGEEMEAYYNHIYIMELYAELEEAAEIHGDFRIFISEGKITVEMV